ncbi:hypothetical protein OKW46_006431 [Paraburkholderia sp. WSM4179]|nr:hypothetical protein [Paraburkholderia sp. WSM4179]
MNSPAASEKRPAAPVKRAAGCNLDLPEHLKAYQGVWIFLEHDRGHVHSVSWELLGEARKLADKLGSRVAVAVLGGTNEPPEQFASEPFSFGADKAYVIHDPVLLGYRNEPFTKGLTDLANKYRPEILLFCATSMGRDLAGSVATYALAWKIIFTSRKDSSPTATHRLSAPCISSRHLAQRWRRLPRHETSFN